MERKLFTKLMTSAVCVLASACTQQQTADMASFGERYYGRSGMQMAAPASGNAMSMAAVEAPAAPVMDVSSQDIAPVEVAQAPLSAPASETQEEQRSYAYIPPSQASDIASADLPASLPAATPAEAPTSQHAALQLQPLPEPQEPKAQPQPVMQVVQQSAQAERMDSGKTHTLQAGETLYRVSRTYAVPLDELIALNHITDINSLKTGTTLRLPATSLTDAEPAVPVMQAAAPAIEPVQIASADASKLSLPKAALQKRPFIWPVEGDVISRFGPKSGGLYNDGMNISARLGDPVRAISAGDVIYSGNELKGYGNLVILKHPDGYLSAYAHMQNIGVEKGAKVLQGDIIGQVGQSGHVDKPQLHFGLRKGKKPVDPMTILKDAPKASELAAL